MSKSDGQGPDRGDDQDDEPEVEAVKVSRGVSKLDILNRSIPEADDWEAKTYYDLNDPYRVATLKHMSQILPSTSHQQPIIDTWLDSFIKNKTSLRGQGREDMYSTIKAAFGQQQDDEADKIRRNLAQALAGDLDDDG